MVYSLSDQYRWGDLYVSMHKHQFHSQIAHFNDTWNRNYAGINACNKLLADEVIAADITTSSQLRLIALFIIIFYSNFVPQHPIGYAI